MEYGKVGYSSIGGVIPSLWMATVDPGDVRDLPHNLKLKGSEWEWTDERHWAIYSPINRPGVPDLYTTLRFGWEPGKPHNQLLGHQQFLPLQRMLQIEGAAGGNPISSVEVQLSLDAEALSTGVEIVCVLPHTPPTAPAWALLPKRCCCAVVLREGLGPYDDLRPILLGVPETPLKSEVAPRAASSKVDPAAGSTLTLRGVMPLPPLPLNPLQIELEGTPLEAILLTNQRQREADGHSFDPTAWVKDRIK